MLIRIVIGATRTRGKLKQAWMETIKKATIVLALTEG